MEKLIYVGWVANIMNSNVLTHSKFQSKLLKGQNQILKRWVTDWQTRPATRLLFVESLFWIRKIKKS